MTPQRRTTVTFVGYVLVCWTLTAAAVIHAKSHHGVIHGSATAK